VLVAFCSRLALVENVELLFLTLILIRKYRLIRFSVWSLKSITFFGDVTLLKEVNSRLLLGATGHYPFPLR
jgi:hypothetical protein